MNDNPLSKRPLIIEQYQIIELKYIWSKLGFLVLTEKIRFREDYEIYLSYNVTKEIKKRHKFYLRKNKNYDKWFKKYCENINPILNALLK